ncbi:MAG: sulfide/dihydroorotate dehydrogenase-like FAD/NAD-binding protein [Tissierellia bacterium]|nr:sulfide/dihydroorotate dehydrogenase-like FAD/NAD-binding protein [Tissierellia bacterium]
MYKIVEKRYLTPSIFLMKIDAPRVAEAAQPGQFVIVITDELSERVPYTIAGLDLEAGTVDIVVQEVGPSSTKLGLLEAGDSIFDFAGPLGRPSDFMEMDIAELRKQRWLFVGGGVGVAPAYLQIKYFADNKIPFDVIVGAKSKDIIIYEDELRALTDNLYITTDDGSYGMKGMVTDMIQELVENQGIKYDHCVAIGPMVMMKFACLTTKKYEIPTTVSLNPIMVDGTGMCGACRVHVGDSTQFACVDGPEFDGHLVDFDLAMKRQRLYGDIEKKKGHAGECMCKKQKAKEEK